MITLVLLRLRAAPNACFQWFPCQQVSEVVLEKGLAEHSAMSETLRKIISKSCGIIMVSSTARKHVANTLALVFTAIHNFQAVKGHLQCLFKRDHGQETPCKEGQIEYFLAGNQSLSVCQEGISVISQVRKLQFAKASCIPKQGLNLCEVRQRCHQEPSAVLTSRFELSIKIAQEGKLLDSG